jgi:hypothetical protein
MVAAVAIAACMTRTSSARADVSSWLSAGGGYGVARNADTTHYDGRSSASFAIGVGTDPLKMIVVGGVFRSTTYFALGTDLGVSARVAMGSFARGQWGVALDFGPMWRSFGYGEYGRWPLGGMVTLGGPWGVQLAAGADVGRIAGGDASARGAVALLELDMLRLTVMRQGATDRWWENPAPAGGRPKTARSLPLAGLLW